MTVITAAPLPADLPTAAVTTKGSFPEDMRDRHGNGDADFGVVRSGSNLYGVYDPSDMQQTAPGADFRSAVAAAAAISKAGQLREGPEVTFPRGTAVGVFAATTGAGQAKAGAYFLAPLWWASEGNDDGDQMLEFDAGDRLQPLSTQVQAVVTDDTWVDMRPAAH